MAFVKAVDGENQVYVLQEGEASSMINSSSFELRYETDRRYAPLSVRENLSLVERHPSSAEVIYLLVERRTGEFNGKPREPIVIRDERIDLSDEINTALRESNLPDHITSLLFPE